MPRNSESNLKARIKVLEAVLRDREKIINKRNGSDEKYRHYFHKSPTMIYVLDINGRFLNINAAGAQLLGFPTAEEVIGRSAREFLFYEKGSFRAFQELFERFGVIREIETKMRTRDGSIRDIQLTAAMRTTVTGKLGGYEGFVIDITKRKRAEKELAESEAKYRAVLENSLAAIYMFEGGGYLSYVNPQMVSMLGYDRSDEIIGRQFWEFVSQDDRPVVRERGLRREQGEILPRRYKYRMLKKDGSEIWVDMQASNAYYLGRPAVVGNFIDITREQLAEAEIRELSRRLIDLIEEERRSMAADLHDEFGQVLTTLRLEVEALYRSLPDGQENSRSVCMEAMRQIQDLSEKVRAKTSRLRPEMLDHLGLVPTIEWFVANYRQRNPALRVVFQSTGLKRRLPPDMEIALYRVCQEGMLNITRHAGARNVILQLTYSHPKVIFIIKDDGVGFDVDTVGRSMDGRFSSIGLLSMKERIASIGGCLHISSTLGKGTTIRVELLINGSFGP